MSAPTDESIAALTRLDFSRFDYNNYAREEKDKLEPQLRALGFTVRYGRWFTLVKGKDKDSVPVSRGAILMPGEILYIYE